MKEFFNNHLKALLITIVIALIIFYATLPAVNITNPGFWIFLGFILFIYILLELVLEGSKIFTATRRETIKVPKYVGYLLSGFFGIVLIIVIINVIVSPFFDSKSYKERIKINEGATFEENVKEVDFTKVPLLDKDSTTKIGDRVMGEMTDLVSQFYVSNLYTQINYKGDIIRVTPLEYAGIIKYFTNKNEGVSGYITVNSVTGEAKLVRLEKGMKYMPSALFNENLYRKLRFDYPTLNFGTETFELDEEGNPYWIVPIIKYNGVGLRQEITGIIALDPITGDSIKYNIDEVPTWIDHVYSASIILEQVNDWGRYKEGFFNSIFGQKNVVATTEGYNYVTMNDDVYLYTGITSVSNDESNLGFILTNMRTKETDYYLVPGAEEYSAMASAEGQVQQMKYISTFPLLINLNNKPTYLISLKDNAGLVKMYAFVDVVNYQKVVVTDASKGIETAKENYLKENNTIDESKILSKDIKIKSITVVSIDGNSYYYIEDINGMKFRASIKVNDKLLPFIKIGDTINISYKAEETVTEILKLK